MNTRNGNNPSGKSIANLSARIRLESLLFSGAAPGKALVEPKLPPFVGE
jgi:hypothetical protein